MKIIDELIEKRDELRGSMSPKDPPELKTERKARIEAINQKIREIVAEHDKVILEN